MEQTLLWKIDRKIRRQLAPVQTKAVSTTILTGIIVTLVGLLLIILASGFFSILGIIALVAGVGLIVFAYLNNK